MIIPQNKYNNLTREEWTALYDLKNDKNIIIKGADKGSAVVVWDREDYIKGVEKQLGDKDVYEEMCNDAEPLISTIHKAIEKIRKRGDLDADTIKYFMVKDPKFARFYLLPKIYKRLHGSRSTCYFKLQLLYGKHIFFFRFSFAAFGPGSKILHKRY